ncbi:hypothetical protein [Odoribacter lunatus]|uniref:hypothetical protein n=1 Tax=Odoribacter lunatus TaxID=2941335 RepID=UPI00203BF43B|nr:hypothetical protein [Odoribacter lunatus]
MKIEEIEHISFEFIEQNFNVTFADLPEDLFKIWHITTPIDTYLQEDFQNQYEFRIFQYALTKYENEKHTHIPKKKIPDIFKIFQLMLSIPSLRTKKYPDKTAFRVFDFQLYLDLL